MGGKSSAAREQVPVPAGRANPTQLHALRASLVGASQEGHGKFCPVLWIGSQP